jgi:hypothetical protein
VRLPVERAKNTVDRATALKPAPTPIRTTRSRIGGGEVVVVAGITTAVALLYLLDARWHGALGAARNDDWSYIRVAFDFADSGTFRLNGWAQMSLVGQVIAAFPIVRIFGHSVEALQVSVALAGACGVSACYCILRRFLSAPLAALACGSLVLGPVFGSLSVSFMTDVPAFALQAVTLLLGVKALERPSVSFRLLVGSAVTGVLAVSVREYAVFALVAVVVVALARAIRSRDADLVRRVVSLGIAAGIVSGGIVLWRRSLPHDVPAVVDFSADHLRTVIRWTLPHAALTLAAFVVPAACLVSPTRLFRRSWHGSHRLTVVAVVTGALLALTAGGDPFLGNYLTWQGSYAAALAGHAPRVVGGAAWTLVTLAAAYSLIAASLIAVVAWSGGRASRAGTALREREDGSAVQLVATFCACVALLSVAIIAVTTAAFADRCLIILVPFVAGLLLLAAQRHDLFVRARWRVASVAALLACALVGVLFVDASATTDGAAWRAAQRAERLGLAPETVDGGLAWFGLHQRTAMEPVEGRPAKTWWAARFPEQPVCATVVREPAGRQPALARSRGRTIFGNEVGFAVVAGPDQGSCLPR